MKALVIGLVAGSVALAVIIGNRMSNEAMSVVIGVVFGVAASIPTSLLIVAATRRPRDESYYRHVGPDPRPPVYTAPSTPQPPQIYIVGANTAPGGLQQQARQLPEPYSFAMPPYQQVERRYTVIGDTYDDEA